MAQGAFAAGAVNENPPHGLGGGGEEMGAVGKLRIVIADQPQPRLMHERGGLQCLIGRFIRHARSRQLAQFAIDQRQQFIGGLGIALLDGLENAGDVAQSATITRSSGRAPENWASVSRPVFSRPAFYPKFRSWNRTKQSLTTDGHGLLH